jgi:hypothetical protein
MLRQYAARRLHGHRPPLHIQIAGSSRTRAFGRASSNDPGTLRAWSPWAGAAWPLSCDLARTYGLDGDRGRPAAPATLVIKHSFAASEPAPGALLNPARCGSNRGLQTPGEHLSRRPVPALDGNQNRNLPHSAGFRINSETAPALERATLRGPRRQWIYRRMREIFGIAD